MVAVGELIGARYRVERILGHGRIGATYLATDASLNREVVVKVAELSGEDVTTRFRREVAVLGPVSHPAIARVYDAGMLPEGNAYLVTEWVPGEPLDQFVSRNGTLPAVEALEFASTIADALASVHRVGLIHRDLKPSNLIVLAEGNPPVKLIDFGAFGELVDRGQQTLTGEMVGTPLYMAPEQIMGVPQSPATDIYGLGTVLYFMLFGRPPIEADTALGLIQGIVRGEVPVPHDPPVPADVKEFLLRCLSKAPEQRPAHAADAYAEIESIKAALPARPDGPREQRPAAARDLKKLDESTRVPCAEAPGQPAPAPRPRRVPGPAASKAGRSLRILIPIVILGALSIALVVVFRTQPAFWSAAGGIVFGSTLIFGGVYVGRFVRDKLSERTPVIQSHAESLLLDLHSREDLNRTMALYIGQLIERCRQIDERILGMTIVQMVNEYETAQQSDQRQAALMNAAQLLEKLTARLSPWYVRHQKALAFCVSLVGVLSGVVSLISGLAALIPK